MADADLFSGITIERSEEALPKRLVAGRESIPNPFTDAVKDSYDEAMDANVGPDKAVRAITVPVDKKITVKTQTRKDKNGKESATQWQQHENVNRALYFLRQAAQKHDIGVRIVVDYTQDTLPEIKHTIVMRDKDGNPLKNQDGTEKTQEVVFKNVTLNKFKVTNGRVRIRFLGQKKKEVAQQSDETQQPAA